MDRSHGGRPLEESERGLIDRARQGDGAAFEELVRRYQGLAFRVAYVITGSAEDAEDAAQDAFVRAYGALHRFRADAPFRPWLLTIVANVARTRRTAATRHPLLSLDTATLAPAPDDAPEDVAIEAERQRDLLRAVNALRGDDRQVIVCRYFLDLSEAEMAEVLGCPRGTVKSRLFRSLRRLRGQLEPAASSTGGLDA